MLQKAAAVVCAHRYAPVRLRRQACGLAARDWAATRGSHITTTTVRPSCTFLRARLRPRRVIAPFERRRCANGKRKGPSRKFRLGPFCPTPDWQHWQSAKIGRRSCVWKAF
ncbi:hypothetical protein AX27061_0382 [Achromobacter xylosoxidans NBRC 15126 = ATCC 27061]|nr:hypothetical protein AX27061_0382 [Achromobacter xylosoxidans NBRC 15126 = ATCC 27061]